MKCNLPTIDGDRKNGFSNALRVDCKHKNIYIRKQGL